MFFSVCWVAEAIFELANMHSPQIGLVLYRETESFALSLEGRYLQLFERNRSKIRFLLLSLSPLLFFFSVYSPHRPGHLRNRDPRPFPDSVREDCLLRLSPSPISKIGLAKRKEKKPEGPKGKQKEEMQTERETRAPHAMTKTSCFSLNRKASVEKRTRSFSNLIRYQTPHFYLERLLPHLFSDSERCHSPR